MGSSAGEIAMKAKEEFLRIMDQDCLSKETLGNAFEVLGKAKSVPPADLFCSFMEKRDVKLTHDEVEETIRQVTGTRTWDLGNINYEQFVEIIKFISAVESAVENAVKKFLGIMSQEAQDRESEEALRNAFEVLYKVESFPRTVLICSFMEKCGVKLTLDEVEETIRQVTGIRTGDLGNINYEQFVEIIKFIRAVEIAVKEFLRIMSQDCVSEKALRNAFEVLCKAESVPRIVLSCSFMEMRGVKLTLDEVKEKIRQVTGIRTDDLGNINYGQFVEIIKFISEVEIAVKEFLKIMSKECVSEEALKKAFEVLCKDESVPRIVLFCSFMENRGVKLTLDKVKEKIRQVTGIRTGDLGNINYKQFVEIIKLISEVEIAMKEFLRIMSQDCVSEKALRSAFEVLCKAKSVPRIVLFCSFMEMRGVKLTLDEVKEKIRQVTGIRTGDLENINYGQFVEIIKFISEVKIKVNEFLRIIQDSDSEEALRNAFEVLCKAESVPHTVLFCSSFMEKLGVKITLDKVEETIRQVTGIRTGGLWNINKEQFVEIIKLIKNPSVMDQLNKIYKALCEKTDTKPFVLYGESGVGKTWMARKVADHAIRKEKFDVALWIYLDRVYSPSSLKESIVRQLSILPTSDEPQAKAKAKAKADEPILPTSDEPQAKAKADESILPTSNEPQAKAKADESILPTSDEPQAKAKAKTDESNQSIRLALKDKRLLLILDNEGSKMEILDMNELLLRSNDKVSNTEPQPFLSLFKTLALDLDQLKSLNVLVTKRKGPTPGEFGMRVMPLTRDEAKSFVKGQNLKDLADFFIGESRKFPSEVLLISKTLSYFGESEAKLLELKNNIEKLKKDKNGDMSYIDLETLLVSGYERLPKSVLIDCFSTETLEGHFLDGGNAVNYKELISYWIMEGHLGHFNRVEHAYEEGHRVLMELLDCGLLRNQESGCVVPSESRFKFDVKEYYEFFHNIRLGLATAFDCKLGEVGVTDGMIRTVAFTSNGVKKREMSTLILDGNYIGDIRSDSGEIFGEVNGIESLAIFNPTGKYFPLNVSNMKQGLRLLVLRGCEFSESIGSIFRFPSHPNTFPELPKLTVFEISGPSSVGEIPDGLFSNTPNLKTINFSFLKIKFLPKSFYNLTKLETLILRGCAELKELGSLKKLGDLEALDISGSKSLEKIVDKRFDKNKKLRVINLSETKIETIPLIRSLEKLKSLSLNDCNILGRVRKSNALKVLEVLDISGAEKVKAFIDPSLEGLINVEFLDVSKTDIVKLPSNLGNPRYVYLRNCPRLYKLGPVEDLSRIEVLDLSGSEHLKEIKADFFKNAIAPREINLSKTSVSDLSFLKELKTLRKLLMSECLKLVKLDNLSELVELEFVDISGCENVEEIEDNLFDKMPVLHFLDLSGLIRLSRLPSLSKLVGLKKLLVKNCSKLSHLPGLEGIPALEILDHSGTNLNSSLVFHPDHSPIVLGPIFSSTDNIDIDKLLKDLGASDSSLPEVVTSDGLQESVCNWSISNWQGEENGHNDPVSGFHFLRLLNKYPSLLRNNFGQFNFLICPSEKQAKEYLPDKYEHSHEIGLREVYLSQLTQKRFERCLEIRGFKSAPSPVEHLLQESELIVLVDNSFLRFLHDFGFDGIKDPKSCWIESCNEMEHVIGGNNTLDSLEILWISEVPKLKSLLSLEIQTISFTSLKSLYLEFCPNLDTLCSSSMQLENLEILYIKYCQKLGTLFSDDSSANLEKLTTSANLEKLTALHLWGLPELKKVACKAQSLTTLRIGECPSLESISILPAEEIEYEGHDKLKILHIKFCQRLTNILETRNKDEPAHLPSLVDLEVRGLPNLERIRCRGKALGLESLKIAECPLLESVVDWDVIPNSLKVLEVKCCDKLKTIVGCVETTKMPLRVERVELLCLPELQSIGVQINEDCCDCVVWGCPKLKNPK